MRSHLDYSDDEFIAEFEACTFPPELFSHEAHLRYTWMLLHRHELEEAVEKVTDTILKFVSNLNAQDKFHMTLTVAAVKVVHSYMQQTDVSIFVEFTQQFPVLKSEFKRLIQSHYSFDVFNSNEARKVYFVPDLIPF